MVWTEEMRAKAAATRAENRRKKEERQRKREEKYAATNGNGNRPVDDGISPEAPRSDAPVHSAGVFEIGQDFDWEEAPLAQCITKAADMKREYERVAAIIVKRQNPVRNQWTCWTYENKDNASVVIPASVRRQCLKRGDDGRWKFRDDGRFVVENGVRTLRPAFCCSNFCYMTYQSYRVRQKLEQRA